MIEIKPCFFCGGKAQLGRHKLDNVGIFWLGDSIVCTKCGAFALGTMPNLARAWNERPSVFKEKVGGCND